MRLSLVVDMHGCPNRCKHCWLGHMTNYKMNEEDDLKIIEYFQPYFKEVSYYSWLREPDYTDNYKERWERDNQISTLKPMRFELASFYRIVRDPKYIEFLKSVGTKKVQLTFFGLKEMTDKYVGRKNAFEELLEATEILIENKIAPRWQAFINEENKEEIVELLNLIDSLHLYDRCKSFGSEFKFFVHAGSCDGENRKLYPIRITHVPEKLIPYFLDYDLQETEQQLCTKLKDSQKHITFDYGDDLVLNISNQMDVYFNYTHMTKEWRIGNIKEDTSLEIMRRIQESDIEALRKTKEITIGELIQRYGELTSQRLFEESDYVNYLFNKYLENTSEN